MTREIWAVVQRRSDGLAPVTFEVLGAARQLADQMGGSVAAVVIGDGAEALASECFKRGASKVYVAAKPGLNGFVDDVYAAVLASAIQAHEPAVVLGGATFYGKAFFARAAALADLGLAPDANKIDADGDAVSAFRPCFGGNVIRKVSNKTGKTFLITLRPKVFPEAAADGADSGEVVNLEVAVEPRVTIKDTVGEKGQSVNLNEADVIVSGGRGLREPDNFQIAHDMADALGAAVGASRAVVDAGWISYAHQIGQTGKTVNPKLYIALGISGAIQHLVGMQSSGIIVAVNKDPDAPIFKLATFGIVGDLFEYAPAMTRVFKERLGS
jgi:electron transfer flavoprotein alpha subunit